MPCFWPIGTSSNILLVRFSFKRVKCKCQQAIAVPLQVDIDHLCKQLASHNGRPISFVNEALSSVFNTMTTLLFGKEFQFEERRRQKLYEAVLQGGEALSTQSFVLTTPPWLSKIIRWIPFTKVKSATAAFQGAILLIR